MPEDRLAPLVTAAAEALAGPCAVPVGTPLAAACSGGADSVALVACLAELGASWPLAAVVFVDHGLREVAAERAAAEAAAARAGVPFIPCAVTLASSGNAQANARRARYAAILAAVGPRTLVATGHTLSDQAETVLQRLLRGAGLRGLAAIAPREGRLVRPLLAVRRAATRGLGLPFVDDPTNATGRYLRNRLRAELLPRLEAENPRVDEALAAVATQARGELALLDRLGRVAADAAGGADAVSLAGWSTAEAAAWIALRHRQELGGPPPRRGALAAAAALAVTGRDGEVDLGRGASAVARAGRVTLSGRDDARFVVVVHGPGTYRLGTRRLELAVAQIGSPLGARACADIAASDLRWPLRLVGATSADLGAGRSRLPGAGTRPVWHPGEPEIEAGDLEIEDALGRKIWPDPRAEGPDGRAGTGLRLFVLPVAGEAERDIGTG
ncbi:MAG: tRNA lysidine(34) synthetase TilS [Myxococcales bacterium]|nr:tRNA lysidine(34) synthetase TilS [Myxococcales bacterium]